MWRSFIAMFVIFVMSTVATNVQKCKKGPFPLSVNVIDCEEPPCNVVLGETAVMEVHFLGTRNEIKNLTTKVYATLFGIHLPYSLPDDVSDVCRNLMYDAMCPIYDGEDVVYKFNFYVDPSYPELTLNVEVTLVDEQEQIVACFVCSCRTRKRFGKAAELKQLLQN